MALPGVPRPGRRDVVQRAVLLLVVDVVVVLDGLVVVLVVGGKWAGDGARGGAGGGGGAPDRALTCGFHVASDLVEGVSDQRVLRLVAEGVQPGQTTVADEFVIWK